MPSPQDEFLRRSILWHPGLQMKMWAAMKDDSSGITYFEFPNAI